jgi:ATP-dependent DNA helicase PIF1
MNEGKVKCKLSAEQRAAIDVARSGASLFLTGSAGTGKSHALKAVVRALESDGKRVLVTATTGVAAVNISGCTLYSAFGLHPKVVADYMSKGVIKWKSRRWENIDVLVIDEISMCTPDLFVFLNAQAKFSLSSRLPFGGVQLVLIGDYFQLPPVAPKRKDTDLQFAFETEPYKAIFGEAGVGRNVVLRKQHRQSEDGFIKILERMREGILKEEDVRLLQSLRNNPEVTQDNVIPTQLFARCYQVDQQNRQNMEKLQTENWLNKVEVSFHDKKNRLPGKAVRVRIAKEIQRNLPISEKIRAGSQVMLTHNLRVDAGLCNGARGVVKSFKNGFPIVDFPGAGTTVLLRRHTWVFKKSDSLTVKAKAVPLRLAWSMTVHKSQGQSIDRLHIELTKCWESGMAYTAFSRATSTKGLTVTAFDPKCVTVNNRVVQFYKKMKVSA